MIIASISIIALLIYHVNANPSMAPGQKGVFIGVP
jgi:hypothetical protein